MKPTLIVCTLVLLLSMPVAPCLGAKVGAPAPDFTLPTFSGPTFSLAQARGKTLLLVFWNTWCINCQRELVELDRLTARYGPETLAILLINTGINDTETKAREYLQRHGYRFPAGFDGNFTIGTAYQVRGVPTVLLIDAAGIIRYQQAGLPDDLPERLKSQSNAPRQSPRFLLQVV